MPRRFNGFAISLSAARAAKANNPGLLLLPICGVTAICCTKGLEVPATGCPPRLQGSFLG